MVARQPLAPLGWKVAVAMLAGVSVVQLFPSLPLAWLSGSSLLACFGLIYVLRGRPTSNALRLGVVSAIGASWACLIGLQFMQQRLSPELSRQEFQIEGRVLGLPQRDEDSLRFDLRVERGDAGSPIGRRVRLAWYGGYAPDVEPGSRWKLKVTLKRPRGVLNPGGFDFERNALLQRIAATGSVRDPRTARLLSNASGIDAERDRLSRLIAAELPNGRGRFVQALAIGDTRGLRREDWDTLRSTGLTHQIAISGFHVGMVAGFGALLMLLVYRLIPTLGRLLPRPQGAACSALVFALAYTALAGFALPTVRTMLMIAVVLAARLLRRAQAPSDSLSLAMLAILAVDPLAVLSPGFWLSFGGVAWLLWCLPNAARRAWLRPFLNAQGVAFIALLPLTAWFFGTTSLTGPLANLLGVPVISLAVVPSALLGLVFSPVSDAAASACWHLSANVMDALWNVLQWLEQQPGGLVWLPEATLASTALASAAAFWLLLPRAVPGKPLAALLFMPLFWPSTLSAESRTATIDVIDVGQGLSVLVRTAHHQLLYDTGAAGSRGIDFGEAAVVPALHAMGVRRLDSLMISHGDNDHAGGMAAVLRAFPATRTLGVEGWARPGMGLCQRTQAWQWDGVRFEVMHPPDLFPYMGNDSSCVLRVEAGGRVAILPGDIGKHVETRLVNEQGGRLRADLLLVPHHGSRTSSSQPFIDQVNAGWVVVSAGADNRFKLPRADIMERYAQTGATILNTADTGSLRFELGPRAAQLLSARRVDRPRYWRERPAPTSGYAIGNREEHR